jgi:hypothetical protein
MSDRFGYCSTASLFRCMASKTIVEAARQLADKPIEWTIVGTGRNRQK